MLIVNKLNQTPQKPIKLTYGDLIETGAGEIFILVCSDFQTLILLDWSNYQRINNFNRFYYPVKVNWSELNTDTIITYLPKLIPPIKKLEYKLELTII